MRVKCRLQRDLGTSYLSQKAGIAPQMRINAEELHRPPSVRYHTSHSDTLFAYVALNAKQRSSCS